MHAFDVLADPVRRRILEVLADGERAAGEVTAVVRLEFGISQPAVSQHLKVLRESGFALVRADGTRRLYSVDAAPLQETDAWLERFRHFWTPRLDVLEVAGLARDPAQPRHRAGGRTAEATEIARGKRERRLLEEQTGSSSTNSGTVGPAS